LQVYCDILNETHFEGALSQISVFATEHLTHPTVSPLQAITLKVADVPVLKGLDTPWHILIEKKFCEFPFVAQLLLHEMTHIYLPDEEPYHSENFWATLREKWLIDFDLVSGGGLNGDESPRGITKRLLDATALYRQFGIQASQGTSVYQKLLLGS
jgi:hypothetical protein